MLIEAQELQNEAVNHLVSLLPSKNNIYFKAPTGSGKTHMMADFMNRILCSDNNIVFIVSSLSKGELAEQNFDNFEKYSSFEFTEIDPYLINSETSSEERLDIETGHNVYVLPRDLYKEKSKLKEGGTFIAFLKELINSGKSIYLIKDECHIATGNLDSISEYFSKTINFSATPKLSRHQYPDVEIKDKDAVNAKLIKSVNYLEYEDVNDNEKSLDKALCIFEDTKKEYLSKTGIAPCMIIQISNKDKAEEEWDMIKKVLDKKHSGLKWMLIVNKGNSEDALHCDTNDEIKKKKVPVSKWKKYAKSNSSTIDIIIFKMVISEGWDIPRACMLYQIRDTQSKQLDEQVIGRVRRNPQLLTYDAAHDSEWSFTMTSYVWGIKDESTRKIVTVIPKETFPSVDNEIKVRQTLLKDLEEEKTKIADIVKETIENDESPLVSESVFDLYRSFAKSNNEVKEGCRIFISDNATTEIEENQMWMSVMRNIESISKKITSFRCDYSKNMYLGSEVSLPHISSYEENVQYITSIDDWLWIKKYDPSTDFSFDSEAEKEWADKLQSLSRKKNANKDTISKTTEDSNEDDVYLWGKNFVENSEIKFQYFLQGIHTSYPDFIMKDSYDRIHLFEVKSVNKSSSLIIDKGEYEDKINALKECYKFSSGITGYDFWLPIKKDNNWIIYHYHSGLEDTKTFEQFKEYIKNP